MSQSKEQESPSAIIPTADTLLDGLREQISEARQRLARSVNDAKVRYIGVLDSGS